MNWYYVEAGQQAGPVDEAQLDELARAGKIQPETLVWREGMANWQPLREARPGGVPAMAAPPVGVAVAAPAAVVAGPNEAVCAECGGVFARQEMIAYGNLHVCARCKPAFMQKLAEGAQLNTGELRYAGFWIRVGAKMVDGLILSLVFIPLFIFVVVRGANSQSFASGQFQIFVNFVQLGFFALNIAYGIFFLGKYGATPGKMACKLKVVTAEGLPISYGRAAGRAFAEILSGLICYIGYIIVGFDGQKRALHDHICNTRVIYR
jgi:uncharacterized RDD family membrane protein YckC